MWRNKDGNGRGGGEEVMKRQVRIVKVVHKYSIKDENVSYSNGCQNTKKTLPS